MARKVMSKEVLINGQNIDAWLEKKPDDLIQQQEIQVRRYDKKLVAFLDLLGITEEIMSKTNGQEDSLISKMLKIKDIVGLEIDSTDITMLYISDSFIFVCDEILLGRFLQILSNIQMRILVECQTLLRGAMEYGDVIIEDYGKQIIGPAYVNAYIKQEKHAIFPRVIIGNSVIPLIEAQMGGCENLVVSQDRSFSLDYVDVYVTLEKKKLSDIVTRFKREGVYDYLLDNYTVYNKKDNPSVRAKYAWTINYLKEKGIWPHEKRYNCW